MINIYRQQIIDIKSTDNYDGICKKFDLSKIQIL
jgi:hypothetical protein